MALKGRDDDCPHSPDEETEVQGPPRTQGRIVGALYAASNAQQLPGSARLSPQRAPVAPAARGYVLRRPPPAQNARRGKTNMATLPGGSLDTLLQERPDLLQRV